MTVQYTCEAGATVSIAVHGKEGAACVCVTEPKECVGCQAVLLPIRAQSQSVHHCHPTTDASRPALDHPAYNERTSVVAHKEANRNCTANSKQKSKTHTQGIPQWAGAVPAPHLCTPSRQARSRSQYFRLDLHRIWHSTPAPRLHLL